MDEAKIRNLTNEDLESCATLFLEIFGPDGCGEAWTPETSTKAIQEGSFNKEYCFVATINDSLVGFALAFPVTRENYSEVFIHWLGVKTAYQGQHIGSSLFQKVEEVAKSHGQTNISLFAHPKYMSYEWYKKNGMKESGWLEMSRPIS